jgi:hypothetical protein
MEEIEISGRWFETDLGKDNYGRGRGNGTG